jgi:hypothetical protein
MNHPVPMIWMAEIQRETVQQGMAHSRAFNGDSSGMPGLRERLAVGMGAILIAAGRRLQAPYKPALGREAEAYRSGC